jgi:hypothetical protein
MSSISNIGKKIVTLDEIEKFYEIYDYLDLYKRIEEDKKSNILKAVNPKQTNGKSPYLNLKYRIIEEEKDNSKLKDELTYLTDPKLHIDYYLKHLDQYQKDRKYVISLSQFLKNEQEALSYQISLNERSFQIWRDEKLLSSNEKSGKRILKNLGLSIYDLNVYETTEPLAYYSHYKSIPQNILIIENKDTFYSMRKYLIEGGTTICGIAFGTLIYGGGKKINKAFQDFSSYMEPYVNHPQNHIMYFGDLDYEGIQIYESLRRLFLEQFSIEPFHNAYRKMIEKVEDISVLRKTKEGQKEMNTEYFLCSFEPSIRIIMNEILVNRKYIPQESLNITDF